MDWTLICKIYEEIKSTFLKGGRTDDEAAQSATHVMAAMMIAGNAINAMAVKEVSVKVTK